MANVGIKSSRDVRDITLARDKPMDKWGGNLIEHCISMVKQRMDLPLVDSILMMLIIAFK